MIALRNRHELKYIISKAQISLLIARVSHIMQLDPHVENSMGLYNIRSLYFDDYNNGCYYENMDGTDPREKMRVRIYNHSSKQIKLECKRKECEKTLKISCSLSKEQADTLIQGNNLMFIDQHFPPVLKKHLIQAKTKLLHPVIIVEYERIPFVYKEGNVRVTFDMNISSSDCINNFFEKQIKLRPIMPTGQHLMEVKYDGFLPDYIYRALNLECLQKTEYSKYCLCRKYS